jgi:hypothetical protein
MRRVIGWLVLDRDSCGHRHLYANAPCDSLDDASRDDEYLLLGAFVR